MLVSGEPVTDISQRQANRKATAPWGKAENFREQQLRHKVSRLQLLGGEKCVPLPRGLGVGTATIGAELPKLTGVPEVTLSILLLPDRQSQSDTQSSPAKETITHLTPRSANNSECSQLVGLHLHPNPLVTIKSVFSTRPGNRHSHPLQQTRVERQFPVRRPCPFSELLPPRYNFSPHRQVPIC